MRLPIAAHICFPLEPAQTVKNSSSYSSVCVQHLLKQEAYTTWAQVIARKGNAILFCMWQWIRLATCSTCGRTVELIVEVVHPQVKLKATCKALTKGARLDFDAILQQTYFALCLWECSRSRLKQVPRLSSYNTRTSKTEMSELIM